MIMNSRNREEPLSPLNKKRKQEKSSSYAPQRTGPKRFADQKQHRYEVIRHEETIKYCQIFTIQSVEDRTFAQLHLKDFWARGRVLTPGCTINIVDVDLDENNVFTVDKTAGFLVVEPDKLLSITSVLNQIWCPRQAVFNEKFRFPGDNIDMFRGILAHDLITQAMLDNVKGTVELNNILQKILAKPCMIQKAYGLRLETPALKSLAKELVPWVVKFMCMYFKTHNAKNKLEVLGVRDIEDNYWNPTFGIKGKLDATIRVKTKDGQMLTIPLEFKTGNPEFQGFQKVRTEHMGQVSLYTLLMRPRYGIVNQGAVYYIREQFWKELQVKQAEAQQLIQMRNDLAVGINIEKGSFTDLPRPEAIEYRRCTNCDYKATCSILLSKNAPERPTVAEAGLLTEISCYKEEELDFFSRWFTVITMELEEGERSNRTSDLWSVPAAEREANGKCLCNLELIAASTMEWQDASGNPCHLATFFRKNETELFNKTELKQFDFVILGTSDELCISYGTIHDMDEFSQTVTVCTEVKINERSSQPGTLFTIDLLPFKSPITTHYFYLDSLFRDEPAKRRLRNYIILKKQPSFHNPELQPDAWKPILQRYNHGQQNTIVRALKTDSFLFVKGMPGTGKTRTIIGLLELLVLWGKSVLVVAYTGVAVDNILLRYKKVSDEFIRIGDSTKMKYPELKQYCTSELLRTAKNVDDFRAKINSVSVVATTLLSLKHEIFQVRKFDYVIVDEASQVLPTAVFGALLLGEKYVLFGDPEQLPPIMRTQALGLMNVPDNLFSMMASEEGTVELTTQYRMNSTIMNLANKLVYQDKMKCGSEKLAESRLHLEPKNMIAFLKTYRTKELKTWMSLLLSRKIERAVMFFDTSKIKSYDCLGLDNTYCNVTEAKIVHECVKAFIECGLRSEDIGLIAPYRGQVELLKLKCQAMPECGDYTNVEINTVDQYQGREKSVIICSFTRHSSPDTKESSEHKKSILDDMRRLNVAITRAKTKLVLVGARDYLKHILTFAKLFSCLTEDQVFTFCEADVAEILQH